MKKQRKMLQLNIPSIINLMELISTQSKSTICNWSIDYAEQVILPIWTKYYPNDNRPQNAINAAREWLSGVIKLPQAKEAIVQCITAAREAESNPTAQAAGRTIHQVSATIHMPSHSIGLALYGALAIAYEELGINASWTDIEYRASHECDKMLIALKRMAKQDEINPAKIKWKC